MEKATIEKLAEELHLVFCHSAHEDQCSWYYENDRENPWSEWTHKKYYDKAEELILRTGIKVPNLIDVIRLLKGFN